jgi:hypothetical protein
LIGYDFTVEFEKRVDNRVADALSRREGWKEEVALSLLSIPTPDWIEKLKEQYQKDEKLKSLLARWQSNNLNSSKYAFKDGLLFYKNILYLGSCQAIKEQVLAFVHSDPMAGHSGFERTMQRAKRDFFWKGMKKDLKRFIRECAICQQNKNENISPAGLLQPLPIPL